MQHPRGVYINITQTPGAMRPAVAEIRARQRLDGYWSKNAWVTNPKGAHLEGNEISYPRDMCGDAACRIPERTDEIRARGRPIIGGNR